MAKYSDEVKAAAMAALLAGQSINQVAREYNIPKGTVSYWKNNRVGRENSTQKPEIAELLLEYLQTNLEALQAQAEQFSNPDWLKRQNASEAAILHGVMTDKAIRLLEALSNGAKDKPPEN